MSFALPLHFADSSPTWTDKEVLLAIGGVAGTIISIGLFALKIMTATARRRARIAARDNQELRKQLEGSEVPAVADLQAKLQKAENDFAVFSVAAQDREASLVHAAAKVKADLESVQKALNEHANDLNAERRRIEKAMRKDGQTWTEKVLASAPEFKPLDPDGRRMPIISVLSLKGGVGKTTIAANLGAALDASGFRTLLLDLDLQGSLSALFLEREHEELYKQEMLLGNFLASSFDAESPNLLDYARPILPEGKSALVPTADEMAYAEMNLTIRWMLRDTRRDPRFLLRKELHMKRVTGQFDIVLLDCPPLINICCINALAASDYILIPILPSKQATARVPVLLQRLKEFKEHINPTLKVMGIVCNRTQRSELTADEEHRLTRLRDQCFDVWGEEVRQLDTFVRQSREVRIAEDERRTLSDGDEMREVFAGFAAEINDRLPMFCRPTSRVATAEGVPS
jgi:cellulose biosynthesis protein BcsQ